jgi:hypothetical protein
VFDCEQVERQDPHCSHRCQPAVVRHASIIMQVIQRVKVDVAATYGERRRAVVVIAKDRRPSNADEAT